MIQSAPARDNWIDAVKGVTISLVAFHHVYVGVREHLGINDAFAYFYFLWGAVYIFLRSGAFELGRNPTSFFTLALLSSGFLFSTLYLVREKISGRLFSAIGRRSLYVYLMHFVPAAGFRILAVRLGISDPSLIILLGTIAAVATSVLIYEGIRRTPLRFLLERPKFLTLA